MDGYPYPILCIDKIRQRKGNTSGVGRISIRILATPRLSEIRSPTQLLVIQHQFCRKSQTVAYIDRILQKVQEISSVAKSKHPKGRQIRLALQLYPLQNQPSISLQSVDLHVRLVVECVHSAKSVSYLGWDRNKQCVAASGIPD